MKTLTIFVKYSLLTALRRAKVQENAVVQAKLPNGRWLICRHSNGKAYIGSKARLGFVWQESDLAPRFTGDVMVFTV